MTDRGAQRPRRGHQNHPKNIGIRASNVPTSEIIQALRDGRNLETLFHQPTTTTTQDNTNSQIKCSRLTETTCDEPSELEQTTNTSNELIKAKRNSSSSSLNSTPSEKSEKKKHRNPSDNSTTQKKKKKMTRLQRSAADGAENVIEDDDEETAELAKLRCTSERTEVIAERENRRQKKCADYPGLAFARSIFSSDSMMKFNIIRNELQNIMNNQLRRVRDSLRNIFFIIDNDQNIIKSTCGMKFSIKLKICAKKDSTAE